MMTPSDYEKLYASSSILPGHETELNSAVGLINFSKEKYQSVQKKTSIPWLIVAAIHFRESNLNFNCHLHNGDPLTARTVHVPTGRPTEGEPPFSWADSAADALSRYPFVMHIQEWTLGVVLEFIERYNGMGYQKHSVNTPYLWSYTTAYAKGMYVSDGSFNPDSVSQQAGCVALYKWMEQTGHLLDFTS